MTFLDEVRAERRRRAKANPVARSLVAFLSRQAVWTPRDYARFAREGYAKTGYVYAAINLITSAAAGIPWILYRRGRAGAKAQKVGRFGRRPYGLKAEELTEVEGDHPLLSVLGTPNPQMAWGQWVENVIGYLELAGNSYVAGVGPETGPNGGRFAELWPLRPDRVAIVVGTPQQPIERYEYRVGASPDPFRPETMLHLKLWNPSHDWYGLSPIEAASMGIDQVNAAKEWNVALLQNAAAPSGALVAKQGLTEEQRAVIKRELTEEHQAAVNAGRPFVFEGEIDWKEMGLSPKDMDWVEGLKHPVREIAVVYRVPPQLLGDTETQTYSNYQEARKGLYTERVLPRLDWLRDELNRWLVPPYGDGLRLDYDRDDIEALAEDRAKVWARIDASQELTVNEKRIAKGYDEIGPEGDVVLVSAAVLPLGVQEQSVYLQPETAPEPTPGEGGQQVDRDLLAGKALNLSTEEQKTAYWKAVDRRRLRFQVSLRGQFRRRFSDERAAIVQALRQGQTPEVAAQRALNAVDQQQDAWMRLLTSAYMGVAGSFAPAVYEAMKAMHPREAKALSWEAVVMDWLRSHGLERVLGILATTKQALRDVLAEGVAAGESIAQLAERVLRVYGEQYETWRAERLARTEVIAASNLGSRAGAEATGLPLNHSWLATRDLRTRDAHAQADGQTVPMGEPFTVGGERLMFPGDTSLGASAENVINCRCTETYEVRR